jgi:hypothetical protein
MPAPKKTLEEKHGNHLARFEKTLIRILSVPKAEIDKREAVSEDKEDCH